MATATTTQTESKILCEKIVPDQTRDSLTFSKSPESHYKDWPNTIGFESDYVQHTPIRLNVTGRIPGYAAGTLYRTGPGTYKITANSGKVVEAHHWFDGFATAHRFQLDQPQDGQDITKVWYNSRQICDTVVEAIRKTGKFQGFGFGQKRDICQNFFGKVMTTFKEASKKPDPKVLNIGVAISYNMPGITTEADTLTTRTDVARYAHLDPDTLEPAGSCDQTVLHPDLVGPMSGTHSKQDPVTGDIYNYNLEFAGPKQFYRVFHVSKETGKTTILAKFEAQPAYIHSILLTEHTVVLCVWNSHITKMGLSILWNQNILDSIAPLNPKDNAMWYVIDRTPAQKGVLATFSTAAFFCFHTINAYEEPSTKNPGTVDIIADLSGYDDLGMLKSFYYDILTSKNATAKKLADRTPGTYRRYKLPSVDLSNVSKKTRPGIKVHQAAADKSVDLPTIHPALFTHPYRYHYGVTDHGYASFSDGLGKYDSKTDTAILWREHGQTPGEPIFIPDPAADPFQEGGEDAGVLLSVVCDGLRELSYLLVLDAKTMKEIGRAEMEASTGGDIKKVVGFGFHGTHVKKSAQGIKISACD